MVKISTNFKIWKGSFGTWNNRVLVLFHLIFTFRQFRTSFDFKNVAYEEYFNKFYRTLQAIPLIIFSIIVIFKSQSKLFIRHVTTGGSCSTGFYILSFLNISSSCNPVYVWIWHIYLCMCRGFNNVCVCVTICMLHLAQQMHFIQSSFVFILQRIVY